LTVETHYIIIIRTATIMLAVKSTERTTTMSTLVMTRAHFDELPTFDGYKVCPTANYREFDSFSVPCIFGPESVFGAATRFYAPCTFERGCTFGFCCRFENGTEAEVAPGRRKHFRFGYRCGIGAEANIASESYFARACFIGNECVIDDGGKFGTRTHFGRRCYIGISSFIGRWSKFSEGCHIGRWADIGRDSDIGDDCVFDKECLFADEIRFGNRVRIRHQYHIADPNKPFLKVSGIGLAREDMYFWNFEEGIYVQIATFFDTIQGLEKDLEDGMTPEEAAEVRATIAYAKHILGQWTTK